MCNNFMSCILCPVFSCLATWSVIFNAPMHCDHAKPRASILRQGTIGVFVKLIQPFVPRASMSMFPLQSQPGGRPAEAST